MNILIYGTSNQALQYLPALALHYTLLGFVDSDPAKQGTRWMNRPVYHPSQLAGLQFDHILIASSCVSEINQTLASYGVVPGIPVTQLTEVAQTRQDYDEALRAVRGRAEASLPKVPLQWQHIAGATLLTDRQALLERLPRQGIVAELGVAAGDFSHQIMELSQPQRLHLIDPWSSERYGDALHHDLSEHFANPISTGQVLIHRQTSLEALQLFPDSYFDWVYIDTTHSYELTREELRGYANKIKPNGIIAGHDYMQGNWHSQCRYGVIEAVHEFCVAENYRILYLTMDISESLSFAIKKNN